MKKVVSFLLFFLLCIMCFLPTTVNALNYQASDTDITFFIDDEAWYVFTRDNLQNNSEIEELGLTADTLQQFFTDNNAYMDAMMFFVDGNFVECVLLMNETELTSNLSIESESKINVIGQTIVDDIGLTKFNIYSTEKYKFIQIDYFDVAYNEYVYEFLTIFNNRLYSFIFKSPKQFDSTIYTEFAIIINSVQFSIIENEVPKVTEPTETQPEQPKDDTEPTVSAPSIEEPNAKNNMSNLGITLICIILVVGTGGIVGLLCCTEDKTKNKKKK